MVDHIHIVIPVYDCWEHTVGCLTSIFMANPDVTHSVTVVDNGSTDYTAQLAEGYHTDLARHREWYLKRYQEPHGYGGAITKYLGYDITEEGQQASHYLFLNNDVYVWSIDWLDILLEQMEENDADILGVNNDISGTRIVEKYGYVSGWCMLMRVPVWHAVDGFDEDFEVGYEEDRDICYTAQDKGYIVAETGMIDIEHRTNVTMDAHNIDKATISRDNHHKFVKKWGFYLKPGDAHDHNYEGRKEDGNIVV